MTHNLDLHDTFSVMIPGACALCLFAYFCGDGWAEFAKHLSELSVGSSIVFLAFCYICGELLQALGQSVLKPVLRRFGGGEPLLWAVPEKEESLGGKEAHAYKLLPEVECRSILEFLKAEYKCNDISKELMNDLFSHIKTKVYAHDAYRMECIKMLTKANFYSTMAVLLVLTPVIYGVAKCACGEHGVVLYAPFNGSICYICPADCISGRALLVILAVSWSLAVLCAVRYRFFNIIYNRILLSSYLVQEKAKAEKP